MFSRLLGKSKGYKTGRYTVSDSLPEVITDETGGDRVRRIVVIGGETFANREMHCSDSQVSRIDYDLTYMHSLAAAAHDFLWEEDSETTAAFITWFGDYDTAKAIRKNVYDSIWHLGDRTVAYVGDTTSSSDAIVLSCPSVTEEPMCHPGFTALAFEEEGSIRLCPDYFFIGSSDYESLFSNWKTSRTHMMAGGEILLHEMTHLSDVVGRDWRTIDLDYEAYQSIDHARCSLMPAKWMIKNANNFMFFALEAKANRHNAAKQVDMTLDDAKYKIARELLGEGSARTGPGNIPFGMNGGLPYGVTGVPYGGTGGGSFGNTEGGLNWGTGGVPFGNTEGTSVGFTEGYHDDEPGCAIQ
ncbi:hypothetical protein CTA2_11418 [Colletotrichum tanaceti]|uniref:Lysine-specific metallo-endopeptidase domain-containing protein n=1 Tax=Colletotrichum tanaceti TaxID=1306861 RepID=A0A4U6XD74_9PEZI|nr:hypothetical protein CTA2_11418 [Colletotrichum tanaceti]TKW53711.1 hypothetical protein CTA1_12987 [Colletotrichum tanaceti]